MSQDIYNTIPRPESIRLFDQSKIDKTVGEIAAIMADPELAQKHNLARDGTILLQFDITSHRLNTVEKERLCHAFQERGWTVLIRNGEMTDQGSMYLTLSES